MAADVKIALGLDLGDFAPSAGKAERALAGIGTAGQASAKQIAAATRQLPAQFTDIATQLAGGSNPLLVLLQQGGQIKDSFGGIGNAVRGVAAAISPAALAIGAVAAGVGTFVTAAVLGRSESDQFRNTLLLTGNAAGLTASRFEELSARVAGASQQTIGGSREIINALAASGQTSAAVLEGQAKAIARIADLSGKSGAEIAKGFAGQLDAPAKFAAKLNESYNFLNIAQFKRIQQLEREGKEAEAVSITNGILLKALDKQKQNLGLAETAWDSLRKTASGAWDAMLNIGRADTLDQQIKTLRANLAALDSRRSQNPALTAQRRSAIVDQLQLLAEQAKQESTVAQRASEEAAKNREGIDKAINARPADPLSAIRDARQQQKADFLRSEKAYYDDIAAEDRKLFEAGLKDPLGEFITERVLPDDTKRAEQRVTSQTAILQDLVDANARASAEIINDERKRGAALIELDRSVAIRRLQQSQLTGEVLAQAVAQVNANAALAQVALDQQISDKLKNSADAVSTRMTDSISEGILEGFRRGSNFADIFVSELKAQFAKTILAPLIRPQVEAGNDILKGLFGGLSSILGLGGGSLKGATGFGDYNFSAALSGQRAAGGPVAAGGTYLVGEQGPELLRMGSQGGTVIPNAASTGALSVQLVVNTSVDARSDQAQVAQIVAGAVAEGQRRMYEDLRARRVIG